MKTTNHKRTHILLRTLLLCLCAAMLTGGVFAEGIADLSDGKFIELMYKDTLPDGRALLAGFVDRTGNDVMPKLLCMNTDMTVSWEYVAENYNHARYIGAAALPDGTIGAVLWYSLDDADDGFILQFFTADGKPTGKEICISVPEDAYINHLTASRLLFADQRADRNYLLDWDGNRIAQFPNPVMTLAACGMIGDTDSLVLFGARRDANGTGKYPWEDPEAIILKTDLQGRTLWELNPLCVWPDTVRNAYLYAVETEDGGILEIQSEYLEKDEYDISIYRNALARLDRDGKILWTSTDGLEDETRDCEGLARIGGKIAAVFDMYDNRPDTYVNSFPRCIRWFDENGKSLGTTVLDLTPEDFERIGRYTQEQLGENKRVDVDFDARLISTQDGLWALARIFVYTPYGDEGDARMDLLAIKVPEP